MINIARYEITSSVLPVFEAFQILKYWHGYGIYMYTHMFIIKALSNLRPLMKDSEVWKIIRMFVFS